MQRMYLRSLYLCAALALSAHAQDPFDFSKISNLFAADGKDCSPPDTGSLSIAKHVELGPLEFTQIPTTGGQTAGHDKRGSAPNPMGTIPASTSQKSAEVKCFKLDELTFSADNVLPIANTKTVHLNSTGPHPEYKYWIAIETTAAYNVTLWRKKSEKDFTEIASAPAENTKGWPDGIWRAYFAMPQAGDMHFEFGFPELEGGDKTKKVEGAVGFYLSSIDPKDVG